MLAGLDQFLIDAYPKQYIEVQGLEAERRTRHRLACQRQSGSLLLTLPREIRDKIWKEAISANVIHVSAKKNVTNLHSFPRKRPLAQSYSFHECHAPNGLLSSACPPGKVDHRNCHTTNRGNVFGITLVCRQILAELPDIETTFFTRNAFQFEDPLDAEDFLFGLSEPQRESITHLRFALPQDFVTDLWDGYGLEAKMVPIHAAWQPIVNYFSNPWDRKSLHMLPYGGKSPQILKGRIYFYYSSCYYTNAKYRLHKRWQVGHGNTSWNVVISKMIHKGCPKIDIALHYPTGTYRLGIINPLSIDRPKGGDEEINEEEDPWDIKLGSASTLIRTLSQFNYYDGLTICLYNEKGFVTNSGFEKFVSTLQEHVAGPIGPRPCVTFDRGHHRHSERPYVDIVSI
ncbi:hypothetical protein BJ875DRAFT_430991 [Amylocarpus encephaloides]|uniref:DUF7730 domain-containing protein n=1 Tax=Amylocarpus encephaloides TaxID=45428 RepID=A0A9P7YD25_9HELO|nr:hypothetical protein BJ875DRAFT_430991 [Amylocarpus encephaloides]